MPDQMVGRGRAAVQASVEPGKRAPGQRAEARGASKEGRHRSGEQRQGLGVSMQNIRLPKLDDHGAALSVNETYTLSNFRGLLYESRTTKTKILSMFLTFMTWSESLQTERS